MKAEILPAGGLLGSKVLRNQATFLGNKLEMFSNTYLGLE